MTELDVSESRPAAGPEIEISVPATSAYLSVIRTAAAGLAARLDFTIDDIEDLRIAVDEACSILLANATPGSVMDCRFDQVDGSVIVTGSVPTPDLEPPALEGFSWTVLDALASDVQLGVRPGTAGVLHRLVITLTQTGKRVEPL